MPGDGNPGEIQVAGRVPVRRTIMEHMNVGRLLIALGVFLVVLGLLFTIGDKLPLRLGRLPGDIYVRGKHTSFYFPIVTCLLLSAVLSLAMWLFRR
jgi:hypothetical protein